MADDIDVVWHGTIDSNTYSVRVLAIAPYQGVLTVTRTADNEVIRNEPVGLAFNAQFGPDVDDVRLWQTMAIEAVDHDQAQRRSNP